MKDVQGQNFRMFLRNELKQRSEHNPNYSLRSFARSLGVSPSSLSMVMGAKMPVTLGFIERVGKKLKFTDELVQSHQHELLVERHNSVGALKNFQFIDGTTFELVKDWYHYAILNLMRTKGFRPQASWIGRRLGISLGEVQTAIENLRKAGLLEIKDGKWIDKTNLFTSHTTTKTENQSAKRHQIQLFKKALDALEEIEFFNRNHTGVTIAVAKSELDNAKDFITEFRKKFMEKFDNQSEADEVYHLGIALFPLTKKEI